nr:hypothetical protein [Streptomyces sp. SID8377]
MQDWSLTKGGGVRSVSVGKGLTGHSVNCVAGDVVIRTPRGDVPIGAYVGSGSTDPVLAYDHDHERAVWASVTATSVSERETLEVVTRAGRTVRCTPEHRFYVPGSGYVAAADLRPGDPLITGPDVDRGGVRAVQRDVLAASLGTRESATRGEAGAVLRSGLLEQGAGRGTADLRTLRHGHAPRDGQDVLLGGLSEGRVSDDADLRRVRRNVPTPAGRPREEGPTRADEVSVLSHLLGQGQGADPGVRGLRDGDAEPAVAANPVLLAGLQGTAPEGAHTEAPREGVQAVRHDVPAEEQQDGLLLTALRRPGALAADDRRGQLAVHRRHLVCNLVPSDAPADPRPRRATLRGLQDTRDIHDDRAQGQEAAPHNVPRAPHQRGRTGQPPGEPGQPLQDVPCGAPQVDYDAVAVVRPVRGRPVRVYDLQVEGTSNFFAGQVLVHNCLIVDDPHKDRADAESEASRRHLHDWYSSTALKRLQPDRNAVVAIMTRWHPDDFAGRRLAEEGRVEDGGRWKVVHLPAIADPKFGPDPLGRQPEDPLPHPKIPTRDRRALLAWWQDMKRTSIVRDWHSLAQGDPQPAEGALVSEELLRLIRDPGETVEPQKIAVAIDPSGGGRDVAGVIGGFLGDDGRVWVTDDVSAAMSSAEWSTAACRLAHRTNAAIIYVEWNFGRDMCVLAIQTSWEALQNAGEIPKGVLMPAIAPVRAKQGKLLRAEPVAQLMVQDKVRLRGVFTDMEREWATWMPTDPDSPGRIDASCVLAYGLIPEANKGAIVHAPLPTAPQPSQIGRPATGAAAAYTRQISR